ncbi:MAG TPA: hypothetical protein VJZ00_16225, partial [Thermoanaerobaculia bacterium]|nr:hypothetical protein [Thermoanaerobaculia bacterium]
MRTPAAALAFELRQRHRWGLIGVVATIVLLGAIKIAVLTSASAPQFSDMTLALLLPVPLAATFLYLLAVFTFGLSGDLAARESMVPRRMLTLPISSAALAGWPMLYGCASAALLWFAMRIAAFFPPGFAVPNYWPALFAASLVAWAQALTWMPYALRGMRIVVTVALLVSIDVVVLTALELKARESTMLLLLAPLVPLAYFVAVSAVRRARCGDVPDWRIAQRFAPAFASSAARRPFRSAARAQLWFEWRRYGRSLPLLVALVLPPGLALLFVFRDVPQIVVEIVVTSLLLPPFLAVFAAAAAGRSSANASESYGITPFLATRPLPDRALVVAKWQAALLSTLAAWLIVAIALPVALLWSQATEAVMNILRTSVDAVGLPRALILGIFLLFALVGATWKQLVQGFSIAMSGRDWAVKGIAFATLFAVTAGFFALGWIFESRSRMAVVWTLLPWLLAVLVALKLALAIGVLQRGLARGLFTRSQLITAAVV